MGLFLFGWAACGVASYGLDVAWRTNLVSPTEAGDLEPVPESGGYCGLAGRR